MVMSNTFSFFGSPVRGALIKHKLFAVAPVDGPPPKEHNKKNVAHKVFDLLSVFFFRTVIKDFRLSTHFVWNLFRFM